jgi:hypothetical protein
MDKTHLRVVAASIFGASVAAFLTLSSAFPGPGVEGKSVLRIPAGSVGIVAYGSLMSLSSMEQTLGNKYTGPIHQIHLEGYERAWTSLRPINDPQAAPGGGARIKAFFQRDDKRVPLDGFVQLNIRSKSAGRVNGILYLITDEELTRFDKREYGYRRVEVTEKIEEFSFAGGRVFAYEGLPGYTEGTAPKGTYMLIREFVDSVTGACDALGKAFRDGFDSSTRPCAYPVVSYKNITWQKAD